MKIAFQGEPGAYSEGAAYQALGSECLAVPCRSLKEVFEKVEKGEVERGVVPIENSIGGSIDDSYDLLLEHQLKIAGETYLPIDHCLLAVPEARLSTIKYAYSHPQALRQCHQYLHDHGFQLEPTYDTAGAAKLISNKNNPAKAAVASSLAADKYDLKILDRRIQTFEDNVTRFLIIYLSGEGNGEAKEGYKTSLSFKASDSPGALYRCLEVFAGREINLTLIHSRPHKGKNWEYLFYLDLQGHRRERKVAEALDELEERVQFLQILGSYPEAH
ncbi:MAG: prephenate dehydratase [Candidatus Bipolaricaulota bacterium]